MRKFARLAVALIAIGTLGALGRFGLTSFKESREIAIRNACIQNLVIIEGAKEAFAKATGLHPGEKIRPEQLAPYLRPVGGWNALACGRQGTYTVNALGEYATCSVAGHAIPRP